MPKRFTLNDPPFADRSGAGVTIAVIDSGVHATHPHVGAIAEAASIDPPDGDTVDRLGHGTAVAAAIRDLAPGASLIVGKIFDRALATNADALAKGIAWATERRARLINLSLGTSNRAHEDVLRASVSAAIDAGALIVAARESDATAWLPGSLPGVVSVMSDARLERNELVVEERGLVAAPYPRSIPGVPRERNLSGVSFAVANVTGFLARLVEGRGDMRTLDDLHRQLSNRDW
jgi:hypothetical protein